MSPRYLPEHLDRFLQTLAVVAKEAALIARTHDRIFRSVRVDAAWVEKLKDDEIGADRIESFGSRFGRMQDTIVDKLLPRLIHLLGEKPGSAVDNLNRAERLGLIQSASDWLVMRGLRNRLVHEYMEDAKAFADALNLANRLTEELLRAYSNVRQYAEKELGIDSRRLPDVLSRA